MPGFYPVPAPQGNVLGGILDFIGKERQLQVANEEIARNNATMGLLNQQNGLPAGVDPFGVQKFRGEGQRQTIAGNMDQRAGEEHSWQGQDRQAVGNVMQGLAPQYANDPILGQIMANAGNNPAIGAAVLGMLGGDRTADNNASNFNTQAGIDFALNTSRDAQKHQQALAQIAAQNSERYNPVKAASDVWNEAYQHYLKTGDRSQLQIAELAQGGRDPQTVLSEISQDTNYNKPGGERDRQRQLDDEAKSKLQQVQGTGANDPTKKNAETTTRAAWLAKKTPIGWALSKNEEGDNNLLAAGRDYTPAGRILKWLFEPVPKQ